MTKPMRPTLLEGIGACPQPCTCQIEAGIEGPLPPTCAKDLHPARSTMPSPSSATWTLITHSTTAYSNRNTHTAPEEEDALEEAAVNPETRTRAKEHSRRSATRSQPRLSSTPPSKYSSQLTSQPPLPRAGVPASKNQVSWTAAPTSPSPTPRS